MSTTTFALIVVGRFYALVLLWAVAKVLAYNLRRLQRTPNDGVFPTMDYDTRGYNRAIRLLAGSVWIGYIVVGILWMSLPLPK